MYYQPDAKTLKRFTNLMRERADSTEKAMKASEIAAAMDMPIFECYRLLHYYGRLGRANWLRVTDDNRFWALPF